MKKSSKKSDPRRALTPRKILKAATMLADRSGISAVSMRKLAAMLKVEAMSLYHHFASKDALLDALVDQVFAEINWTPAPVSWQQAMRDRATAVRAVLRKHPWALGLLESRTSPGPATLAHHDAVLGCLLQAGFSHSLAAHAYALLDSYIYGFALQEQNMPASTGEGLQEMAAAMAATFPHGQYTYLATMTLNYFAKPGYDFADEFGFGLDLILDGLVHKMKESN